MAEKEYSREFKPKKINVLKINNVVDAEIFIKECDFVIKTIESQLADDSYEEDKIWESEARFALKETQHKKEMALIKLDYLKNKNKEVDDLNIRFKKAAKMILTYDEFSKIVKKALELSIE